jgi:hypothetical protein
MTADEIRALRALATEFCEAQDNLCQWQGYCFDVTDSFLTWLEKRAGLAKCTHGIGPGTLSEKVGVSGTFVCTTCGQTVTHS